MGKEAPTVGRRSIDLLSCPQAAKLIGMSTASLASWRSRGRQPQPEYERVGQLVIYRRRAVEQFIAEGGSVKDYVTVRDAARILSVSEQRLRRWSKTGEVGLPPRIRWGQCNRFRRKEIEEFAKTFTLPDARQRRWLDKI